MSPDAPLRRSMAHVSLFECNSALEGFFEDLFVFGQNSWVKLSDWLRIITCIFCLNSCDRIF